MTARASIRQLLLGAVVMAHGFEAAAQTVKFAAPAALDLGAVDLPPALVRHDVDNDGDADFFITASQLGWLETTGRTALTLRPIDTAKVSLVTSAIGDLDGDGDLDFVGATGTELFWFENVKAAKAFRRHEISETWNVRSIGVGNLDGAGANDLAISTTDGVSWLRNEDGKGMKWSGPAKISARSSSIRLWVVDLDKDKNADIVFSEEKQTSQLRSGGDGTFVESVIYSEPTLAVHDVNGDGFVDLLASAGSRLELVENVDGKAFAPELVLAPSSTEGSIVDVDVADFNADKTMDLLVSRQRKGVVAFRQPDGTWKGSVFYESPGTNPELSLRAIDLDKDGRTDVVNAGRGVRLSGPLLFFKNLKK